MILQLINPAPYGGLESVVRHLAVAAASHSVDVQVLAVLDDGAVEPALLRSLREDGVVVRVLFVRPRAYLGEYRAIRRAIRHMDPAVVHSHGYRMDVMARLAITARQTRWMTTLHGFTGGEWKNRLYESIELRAARTADRVVAVSSGVRDRAVASGVDPGRVTVARNALAAFQPLGRDEACARLHIAPRMRWIGWVGRFSAEKDPMLFVDALKDVLLRADKGDVGGVMIGDGPGRLLVEDAGSELIAAGRLRVAGAQEDAGRLLTAVHLMVNTSHTEGTPMAVLEAMRLGVPVVAMAVGGLPDLLSDGAGLLVHSRSQATLAAEMERVLTYPELARKLADAGRRKMDVGFNPVRWIEQYLEIWRQLEEESNR